MTKVHVLADESLGGIKREYVEVEYGIGGRLALEPTGIVHIEGSRFRLVDRKAEVGERVIVLKDWHDAKAGSILSIIDGSIFGFSTDIDDEVFYDHPSNSESQIKFITGNLYRVLTLIEPETSPQSTDDIIANLARRVAELERELIEYKSLGLRDHLISGNTALDNEITGIKRDIETWAQDVENVWKKTEENDIRLEYVEKDSKKLDDKIEMCIDDIVTLDERTADVKPRRCCGC